MSMIKRYIENEAERIAKENGYEYDFIFDRIMEGIEDGDENAIETVEVISQEQDW